jgi:hypothetical protein
MRRWTVGLVLAGLAVLGPEVPAYGVTWVQPTLSVGGQVGQPTSYTSAELAALPQTTAEAVIDGRHVTVGGVPVETLVDDSGVSYPSSLPNTKNELLRVTVTVEGAFHRRVTFALGELDAGFGNHAALVALTVNQRPFPGGPALVVPGDLAPLRFVPAVAQLIVGVATAPATDTSPSPGSAVEVIDGPRTVTLSAASLAALPSENLTVSFEGPSGEQTHTESGPPLLEVLARARVPIGLDTWVAAVGSDNYVATVTPAEQWVGGRPLQLSLNEDGSPLAQPRLVADGDIKGGRYVSGVVDLYAGEGPAS